MGSGDIGELERKLIEQASVPCGNVEELHHWIHMHLGLWIPRKSLCDDHCSPFEYVKRAYFEPAKDQVVWASRGGGKTRLGAVVTLLDLLHKPGVQTRILGGSMEQSLKMWDYLLPDLERVGQSQVARELRGRNVVLLNGSRAGVVSQSQRSVRGMRVHKLRCDEVELFDPAVWEAAQLTVQSEVVKGKRTLMERIDCDRPGCTDVRGTVEALSTHHKPWGLMSKVLERAREHGTPVVHWCLLDVLEKCPPERPCEGCLLRDECQGRAKEAQGFYRIDDAIDMKRRVSVECWEAEMLCKRPLATGRVFPSFERGVHVVEDDTVTR